MADAKTEKQKVKEITDKLEEGLKELFESEKYKSYLSTMSKFHNYSFNNTLLIAMQKPEATLVAGYQAWQKNFNRHVNKGEKGIRILAPAPYKIKEERDKLDPVTGEVMLDKDGMPQTEEVEIKIPAFRAVSVFDVSQTDGEPIPELEAKELLSTVEGYEDFIKAISFVAPAPIGFEDIPGDSKGYFNIEENRIAVQEGMSESQTLKTMVHETAHSMLHDKEVNKDILAPAKDRNTKEVEAESIAYTVCQHFGIDTSEYSFGYIAGWSSGKDMKELKFSLDTIRRTASGLITGIEGQLRELQREKEASLSPEMMQGQEKESLLLVQNSNLSEYSLLNVRGMDAAETVEALAAMNDDDRLNIAAYLESRGAWTTEIANEQTKEFGEYHLDVRYNTDTNEIIDVKAEAGKHREEREAQLLHGDADRYGIYQLKDDPGLRDFHFAGTAELLKRGILSDDFKEIRPENYSLVYMGELSDMRGKAQGERLNEVFEKFNVDHPADYRGHSLSVSDIVVLHENGENSAHFVDSFGFTVLPGFMRGLEQEAGMKNEQNMPAGRSGQETAQEEKEGVNGLDAGKQEPETEQGNAVRNDPKPEQPETGTYPAVYRQSLSYANKHDESRAYTLSRQLDYECIEAIEAAIGDNFDGMHLDSDVVKPVLEKYGEERMAFVLSSTIQQELWDGRFSRDNKDWALQSPLIEDIIHGIDVNRRLIVSSHQAVLNGFVDLFRKEVREREKAAVQEDVQKSELEPKDIEEGDEIIDLGDEREQIMKSLKKSLEGRSDMSQQDVQKQEPEGMGEAGHHYLEGIREARELEAQEQPKAETKEEEVEVTFMVSECGEFHSYGEVHKNIPTVEEAIGIWKQIPPERLNAVPAIGIHLHRPGDEPYQDVEMDVLVGNRIDLEMLGFTPEIRTNPLAMDAIAEIMAKLPEMEIDGMLSERLEAKVREKRMPDLTPAEQLAVEIDRFTYAYDVDSYHDNVRQMSENVSEISKMLEQGDTEDMKVWLNEVISEGAMPEEETRAKELIAKLAEYKPLAKIEEMEEQNYNMVDNILNNGCEKFSKEEAKKAQDKPAARQSLKSRLADKKAQIAGQGKDREENKKNKQREM